MKPRVAIERPTLDLMEEAVHLLRSASISVFGWYLLAVLPFLLGLLYFWTDMSFSAIAFEHRMETSFGLALLFVWMKTGQAIFAGKLHARLARHLDDRVTFARLLRIALFQAIVQPSKLFILPLAALATLPFAWVCAFYENAGVLGRGETVRKFIRRCWQLATFSPRQNHAALSVYLLLLFVVFLNVAIAVVLLPQLIKMFTGFETVFTRNAEGLFNTTFFAVVGTLTYLVCDPLLKTIYALRCFYAESVRSGADLTAELRALPRPSAIVSLALIIFLLPLSPAGAASPPVPSPFPPEAVRLNHAIEQTLQRSEFSWKLPRQTETKARNQWPFVDSIKRFLKATGRVMKRSFAAIEKWLERIFARRDPPTGRTGAGSWLASSQGWMIALIVLLIVAAAGLLVQAVRQLRLRKTIAHPIVASAPAVDLEDEALTADALPEDEWLALARGHLANGDMRLALRAFFLAGLAHLAAREILQLARSKSNRDYQTELRRRAGDQPALLAAFGQNIAAVERVWYGRHEIDQEGVRLFEINLEEIRAC